jgi:site-specific recombinase XerD
MEDYCRRNGQLIVREGKGQRQRELMLPAAARDFLKQWLQDRGSSLGPMFCHLTKDGECNLSQRLSALRIYGIVKRRAREAGIEPCSPHDLRRTFVTRLLEQGVDLNTTRQLAGHEQIQTTLIYDCRSTKSQKRAMANFQL